MATAFLKVTTKGSARRFINMQATAAKFLAANQQREKEAADKATQVSRQKFTSSLGHRPLVAPRRGRPTTGGAFANDIKWNVTGNGGKQAIGVDLIKLPRYSLIQEIGTGQAAQITNPPGGSITVRTQVGRYIAATLVWGGNGGVYPASSGRRGADQLIFRASVNADQLDSVRERRIRIRREIKGKHYLRDGGAAGFSTLSAGLRRDAKRIFQ